MSSHGNSIMNDKKINTYLKRLDIYDCKIVFDDLKKLQAQHMLNIPFENLDVAVGRDILLDEDSLYRKIVEKNRGGYCFELNLLYANLLHSLGFQPRAALGRVWLRNPSQMPPRNHLTHLVDIEGTTFVTDVGFGGLTTRIPLDINSTEEINDGDGIIRIIPFETNQYMVQRKIGDDWANQYSFENVKISEEDIAISNFYMSKNPESHFYSNRFVGRFTEGGRIGLFENTYTKRKGIKTVYKENIDNGEAWLKFLKQNFGLILDYGDAELNRLFGV
jgi:N-hydroxyarylamine O-acetyltransferase